MRVIRPFNHLTTKPTQIRQWLECACECVLVYNVTIWCYIVMCAAFVIIILYIWVYRVYMCVRVMICVTKRFSGFYVFTIWRFIRCTETECVEAPQHCRLTMSKFKVSLCNIILYRKHVIESRAASRTLESPSKFVGNDNNW